MTKDKILKAVEHCIWDQCGNNCPLYTYNGDCQDFIMGALSRGLPNDVSENSINHDWDAADLTLTPDKPEEPEYDPCIPRTAFIERDHLLDEIEDARGIIDCIEKAWADTEDFAEDRMKDMWREQLKELDRIQENVDDYSVEDLDHIFELQDRERNREIAGFEKARKHYEEDLKEAQADLELAKAKLAEWDMTHDARTGAPIGVDDVVPDDKVLTDDEKEAAIEDMVNTLNALYGDDFDNIWKRDNEVIDFAEFLKEINEGELSDEDIEAAKNIKNAEDLVRWLFG